MNKLNFEATKMQNFRAPKARLSTWAFVSIFMVSLSGCNPSFHDLGIPPTLTAPGDAITTNRLVPKSPPKVIRISNRYAMTNNSFWNAKDGVYFRDSRAYEVGDILTVRIVMNERAKFKNRSDRDTSVSGGVKADTDFSLGTHIAKKLTADATGTLDTKLERGGTVNRSEVLKLSVAAVVIEAAPNGNLYVHGTQEIRVNHEMRVLTVQGFVRSKDILPDNTIAYDKIAEARISYGGNNTRNQKKLFSNPYHKSSQYASTAWMR
ncbi:MAG: flagellar basal body L-ring protein FlgH [Rhizobiaceae bacterium]|nr:flagellar basal body L-ring protein FlgH [Rhizobiaceae bacterium]